MSAPLPPIPEWSGVELQLVPLKRVWHWLGLFESTEYARRAIANHSLRRGQTRTPNVSSGRDLAACVKQGRGYFEAASEADILVAPLLLHYGVAALAKAVVIARATRAGLHVMTQGHGLSVGAFNLGQIGSAALASEVMSYSAKIGDSGTFIEYAEALDTHISFKVYDATTKRDTTLTIPSAPYQSLSGQAVSLDVLLARQPALRTLYHQAISSEVRSFLVLTTVRYSGSPVEYDLQFPCDRALSGLPALIERSFPALVNSTWTKRTDAGLGFPFDQECDCTIARDALPMFPLSSSLGFGHTAPGSAGYATAPFSFGVLNEALQLYLISYLLGMLARYYPSAWLSVISGGPGDAVLPLLRGAIDLIRDRFPSLALAGLTSYAHELSFSTY